MDARIEELEAEVRNLQAQVGIAWQCHARSSSWHAHSRCVQGAAIRPPYVLKWVALLLLQAEACAINAEQAGQVC